MCLGAPLRQAILIVRQSVRQRLMLRVRTSYLNSASAPNVTRRQAASRETADALYVIACRRASAANVTRRQAITYS
ncbi:hypothetical protein BHE74_00028906, partial [Ensete ventricosum]